MKTGLMMAPSMAWKAPTKVRSSVLGQAPHDAVGVDAEHAGQQGHRQRGRQQGRDLPGAQAHQRLPPFQTPVAEAARA